MQQQPLSSLAPGFTMQSQPYTSNQYPVVPLATPACAKPQCTPPPSPCKKPEPVSPCDDPCAKKAGYGWGWLGALVLWFIIFTVIFWLIFYSLKPSFVLQSGSNQVDTAKVLLAAVIAALILVVIIWLIKAAIGRRY
jgi:hypothetical protein